MESGGPSIVFCAYELLGEKNGGYFPGTVWKIQALSGNKAWFGRMSPVTFIFCHQRCLFYFLHCITGPRALFIYFFLLCFAC